MKLNKTIHQKLVLQAEEAYETGLTKLARGVFDSIDEPRESGPVVYSSIELDQDIYKHLWKVALDVAKYYDLEHLDIQKVDDVLKWAAQGIKKELESKMLEEGTSVVGPLEPKLPGQSE